MSRKAKNIYSMPKDRVKDMVASFEGYDVYAPQMSEEVFMFQKVLGPNNFTLAYPNTVKPPKHIVFPQSECLLEYMFKEKGFELTDKNQANTKTIIFGLRDCDARAMLYLDKVMLEGDYIEPYYKGRRKSTTLIGLACNNPPYYNCFCTSLGGGPHSNEGLDIHMTELSDTYLMEAVTETGKEVLEKVKHLFNEPKQEELDERKKLKKTAEEAIVRHLNIEGVAEKLDKIFESDYWGKVSDPCIGCGICTFLCPTCFCFDINDIGHRKGGTRVRVWDTCQFPEYTIHASSHNPRSTKKERQRQRFYHKYKYSVDNQSMIGCVGCGRCINQCPTQIDIVEVISGAMEVGE